MNFLQKLKVQLKYYSIRAKYNKCLKKEIFDISNLDKEISKLAQFVYESNKDKFKTFDGNFVSDVGFFASELYDTGGHTPCLVNLATSLFTDKPYPLFLSKANSTKLKAPKTMESLKDCTNLFGVEYHSKTFVESMIDLYNQIVENAPKIAFIYISQWDLLFSATMSLIKKTTNIKFVYFNHATHFPCFAMTYADLILEEMPITVKTTKEKRHLNNCEIVGLQSKSKNEVKYYSQAEKQEQRNLLNVKDDEYLTVTGGASYKYFNETTSPHFEMIKNLLIKEPKLKHLAITNLSIKEEKIIDKIFEKNPNERQRIIIKSLTPKYELLFQSADVFVDSFPMSSSMTQIDLMGMKVATAVKINNEKPFLSFHEFMPSDYKYMFDNPKDMEIGILELLHNKESRNNAVEQNYNHWLKNFEKNAVKEKYLKIINKLLIGD